MVTELFLKNIEKLMDERRESMSDVARVLEVSQPTVSNWWRRFTIPTPPLLDKLCAHYGVKPDYFFKPVELNGKDGGADSSFEAFIDELAAKYLEPIDRDGYHFNGGAKRFLALLRSNYETDELRSTDWYLDLVEALRPYVNLDLMQKIQERRAARAESIKKKSAPTKAGGK